MFDIEYKGGNSVIISTRKSKLVVDPNISILGLNNVKADNSVELVTEDRFKVGDKNPVLVINSPGEYGVQDFDIRGIPALRHIDKPGDRLLSTMYRISIGEIRIGILGNIDKDLSEDQLEALGVVDILIIPVGGNGYTLDAVDATKIVKLVEPKIVVPIHYADKAIKYEVPQDELQRFVNELGAKVESVDVYKFKQLPIDQGSIVIVEIKRS